MATYYASVLGLASNNGLTRATAKRTIAQAMALASAGDEVLAMDDLIVGQTVATFGPEASTGISGVKCNGGVTLRFEPKAILDQQNQYLYGILAPNKQDGCKVIGANIRRAQAGIVMTGTNYEVAYCDIRETTATGISCNAGADGGFVHHNYVERADSTENARTGISAYEAEAQPNADLISFALPAGLTTYTGGFGMVFWANVVVAVGYDGAANADGNSFIWDVAWDPLGRNNGGQATNPTSYSKHVLYYQNIGALSFGCGHKIMMSRYCHVLCNTMVGNKRSTYVAPGGAAVENQWKGEFANYHSGFNEHAGNIAVSFNTAGGVLCLAKNNTGTTGKSIAFVDNNVYNRNMFWNTTAGAIVKTFGGSPAFTPPPASANGNGGYILADPKLVGPWTVPAVGAVPLQGGLDFWKARCALQATSPARGAGPGGIDLGAVPYTEPPPSTWTKTTDPALTFDSGRETATAGDTFTIQVGTYSSAPDTRSWIMQWWNGASYVTVSTGIAAAPDGSGKLYGTVPSVATRGGLRCRETAVKAGFSNYTTPSNWKDILPPDSGAAPTFSDLPVISYGSGAAPVVGVACSCLDATAAGNPTPTVTRQWRLDGANISGATGNSYTPVSGDIGKVLTVVNTATNGVGADATATSAGTPAVVASVTAWTTAQLTTAVLALQSQVAAMQAQVNDIRADVNTNATALTVTTNNVAANTSAVAALQGRCDGLQIAFAELSQVVASIGGDSGGDGGDGTDLTPLLNATAPLLVAAPSIGSTGGVR